MAVKVVDNVTLNWDTDPTHLYVFAEVADPTTVTAPYSTIARDDGIYIVVGMLKGEITPLQIYYPMWLGYSKASVEANPRLETISQECKMCGRTNKYFENTQKSKVMATTPNQSYTQPQTQQEQSQYQQVQAQPEATNPGGSLPQPPSQESSLNVAAPPVKRDGMALSSIARMANVGQNVCCRPAGRIVTSTLLSEFFRILADQAQDPGLKDSIGDTASTFAENIDIPDDQREEFKHDLVRGYDTYRKSGSIAEALKTVMFRGVGDMLKDGVKLTKTEVKQTTYTAAAVPMGHGNMIR